MPKYLKEILLGFIPVLFIFMAFLGINIFPIVIAAGMLTALLIIAHLRGGLTVNAGAGKNARRKDLQS